MTAARAWAPSSTWVVCLGLSQLVAWGALHYLIGVFGSDIGASLGWSSVTVHGGFSVSLVVMGLSSRWVGAWIDASGGRRAMLAGSWLGAAGCIMLATTRDLAGYYAAWVVLGLAMRLSLYDAAFASLVKVLGARSQRPMTVITLFGGLASTVFWPLGHVLASLWGWRGALLAYAVILACASLLHLRTPVDTASRRSAGAQTSEPPIPTPARHEAAKMGLYGLSATLILFMQAGMAAHFITLLAGLGWSAQVVIVISTCFGVGQVAGRLYMVLHGHRFAVLHMNVVPPSLLLLGYAIYFTGSHATVLAGAFALFYGAGNGIATITRGAVPVALFGPRGYGLRVGRTLLPAFLASAAAPTVMAWSLARYGTGGTVALNMVLSATLLAAALALNLLHRSASTQP